MAAGQRYFSESANWTWESSLLFFFSSRRRHTRWPRDWSSDVCSSDLAVEAMRLGAFDFISKPLSRAELRLRVERAMRDRRSAAATDPSKRRPRKSDVIIEIGRASCRERVEGSVVAGSWKRKGGTCRGR